MQHVLPHPTRAAAVLLGVSVLCSTPAWAQMTDQVDTRNGDTLTGEVKALAAGRLDFKTAATDTIQVYWDHVTRITSGFFFEVLLADGRRLFGALLEPDEPGVIRVGTDAASVSAPLGEVARIERIRLSFWSRLKGTVDLGFTLNKANRRTDISFKVTTNVRARQGAWSASYEALYRRQDNAEDLDRQDLNVAYRRFLGGNWLVSAFGAGQRNTELGLDIRFLAGAGAGYHIVRTVEHDLVILAGLDATHENFLDGRDAADSVEAFFGISYDLFALGERDFIVAGQVAVFPSLSVRGRVRTEISLDVRKELWKDFFLPVRGFFSSDNSGDSADDRGSTTDYGMTLGIGYSW